MPRKSPTRAALFLGFLSSLSLFCLFPALSIDSRAGA